MPGESPFAREWRACLQAHYMYVVRVQDQVAEPTLRVVMRDIGFSDAELGELYIRATAHVDDLPPDFTPDPAVFAAVGVPEPVVKPEATPPPEPESEAEVFTDEEPSAELDETADDPADDPPPDPDAPVQLSLF